MKKFILISLLLVCMNLSYSQRLDAYAKDEYIVKDSLHNIKNKFKELYDKDEITTKEYELIKIVSKILSHVDYDYSIECDPKEFHDMIYIYDSLRRPSK